MNIRYGLLTAAIALGFPGAALADDVQGPYIGFNAGGSFTDNAHIKGTEAPAKPRIIYNPGVAGGISAGYAFGNGIRVEAEGIYRDGIVSKVKGPGVYSTDGRVHTYGGIASGYYDFATGTPWTPFVGAGVGGIVLSLHHLSGSVSAAEPAFAYQATAGLGYDLTDELNVGVEYKYLATPYQTKFDTGAGSHIKLPYANHAFLLGVRYTFGEVEAPAPVPPAPVAQPTPAPAPVAKPMAPVPQTYLVFFDFNKSVITKAAEQVIAQVAADVKKGKPVQVIATGHTDTVGSAKYNQALSVRRAEAVKADLIRKGVPGSEIVTVGKGKSEPRVPTADNVREPQNRRVEVIFK